MALSLSKDVKSEVKEEVKPDISQSVPTAIKEAMDKSTDGKFEIDANKILIEALSTIKSKLEAQPHKHKEKILTKLKGAIELLIQN